MSIHTKLLDIQTELKAPKNQRNSFGGYNYRSCEDITEAVKPLLGEIGASLTMSDSIELIGERYYVKATATLTDTETGEAVSVTAFARETADKKGMDASQVTGATSSYARKYALNGLFCIDDNKDADTDEHAKQAQNTPSKPEAKAKPTTTTTSNKPITKTTPVNVSAADDDLPF